VNRLDHDRPEAKSPPVLDRLVGILGSGQPVDVDGRARGTSEAAVAGHVVGVIVRLDHVLDPHSMQATQAQVRIDVPLRVDHRRDTGRCVAHEVRAAPEVLVDDLAKQRGHVAILSHVISSPRSSGNSKVSGRSWPGDG
jgi:hypothetical protein